MWERERSVYKCEREEDAAAAFAIHTLQKKYSHHKNEHWMNCLQTNDKTENEKEKQNKKPLKHMSILCSVVFYVFVYICVFAPPPLHSGLAVSVLFCFCG